MSLLSVRNLSVEFTTYGQTSQVLHNVSLEVPAHAQIALVGESGSGKTVTMKAIMGLLRQPPARITAGEILYDGRDLLTMADRDRVALRGTAMSMVFQDPMSSLNPVFTIADQMATILKYADRRLGRTRSARDRMARVHEVLSQVRMREPERVSASYPIMLSGGMRQRVLIAMALLMITHHLGVVRATSNTVYVMHKGEIVESGPTDRIFAAPQQQYTRDLIAAVPRLTGRVAS